mmetsp:Transcript_25634/g.56119  ORF Transcript_25634/g.56119 Transcript_25634/m.56119 type:complete len:224 (-) Transcript_25634:73-744(-)
MPGPPPILPEKAALIMIDFQRDFCDEGGYADASFGGDREWVESIIPRASSLLRACRNTPNFGVIVHTREGYAPDLSDVGAVKKRRSEVAGAPIGRKGPLGQFLIRGEYGQDTIDRLRPLPDEIVLDKNTFGAFVSTNLEDILRSRGIEQIILAGVTADVCVHTTLREAVDRGYECWYCKDAISTPDEKIREACEAMVEHEGGIWGWLVTVDDVIKSISIERAK